MEKRTHLVSVIMPVYNGEDFIAEAIESILAQTYKRLELIVIDDASTDETAEIIKSYQHRFPRTVKAVFLKREIGESAAANVGFRKAKGTFIARMDADDISYPRRIEKQVVFMQKNPHIIVLGTQADVIDASGITIGKKTFPCSHEKIYRRYGIYHPMLHPSCMFRKSLLPRKRRLWEQTHEPNDDYITLFRLLNHGQFANLPDTLLAYRMHGRNKSLTRPRGKIFHFIKIRLEAVRRFHYKPTTLVVLVNIMQLIGAVIIPERLIVPCYRKFFRPLASIL